MPERECSDTEIIRSDKMHYCIFAYNYSLLSVVPVRTDDVVCKGTVRVVELVIWDSAVHLVRSLAIVRVQHVCVGAVVTRIEPSDFCVPPGSLVIAMASLVHHTLGQVMRMGPLPFKCIRSGGCT